jgi:molybdopterin synthase sulfur carrier subunit
MAAHSVIRVLFFARLREQLGCAELEIDWRQELASVAALRQSLRQKQAGWDEVLGDANILCAVNQQQAGGEHSVNAGDEVAFFPPVTGG